MAQVLGENTGLPLLKWDVEIDVVGNECIATHSDYTYTIGGIASEKCAHILSRLDGVSSLDKISAEVHLSTHRLSEFIERLIDLGLVTSGHKAKDPVVDTRVFTELCRRLYAQWKERLFAQELWARLVSGAATQSEFIGWMVESYHFIEGVNRRMPMVISTCDEPHAQSVFTHHFAEEYDHSDFFMKSLVTYGFSKEAIRASRPLPGTIAVLNYTRFAARKDWLAYAVCSGFLESTGADRSKARMFFELITKHYVPANPKVITPMVDHLNLDEAYEHNEMMEEACSGMKEIPLERATKALRIGAGFLEVLILWSNDIVKGYTACRGNPRVAIPRYRRLKTVEPSL